MSSPNRSTSIFLSKLNSYNNKNETNNSSSKKNKSSSSLVRLQTLLTSSVSLSRRNSTHSQSPSQDQWKAMREKPLPSIPISPLAPTPTPSFTTPAAPEIPTRLARTARTIEMTTATMPAPVPALAPAPVAAPLNKLKRSTSARPFSQFFFPSVIKEDETRNKREESRKKNRVNSMILLDSTDKDSNATSSNSSSRSSSIKTIRNGTFNDNINVIIEEEDEEATVVSSYSPTISFYASDTRNQSDFIFDSKAPNNSSNKREKTTSSARLSRARTILGLGSTKNNKSHISFDDTQRQRQLRKDIKTNQDSFFETLSHPSHLSECPLERQNFVRPRLLPPLQSKNATMTRFIINELIETERSYHQLLVLIRDRYMEPMIIASQARNPLVKSSDIPILFNYLPELLQLSDMLLYKLNTETNNIGKVFKILEQSMLVFLKYTMHYRRNVKAIRRACSNVLFVKINQETLSRRETNRLGIADYFIAPIQRIPRYCLLLKDIQKYTHLPDIQLEAALKMLTKLAVSMDRVQLQHQLTSHLSSIRTL